MAGERLREREVTRDDAVGGRRVIHVLAEQIDGRGETALPQVADDGERRVGVQPGDVATGVPERDVPRDPR
jgi:hypothetical protein